MGNFDTRENGSKAVYKEKCRYELAKSRLFDSGVGGLAALFFYKFCVFIAVGEELSAIHDCRMSNISPDAIGHVAWLPRHDATARIEYRSADAGDSVQHGDIARTRECTASVLSRRWHAEATWL